MVPCVSINWPLLQRTSATLLPLLFIPLSVGDAVASVAAGWLGTDAHLYYSASSAWLAGGSPWAVSVTNQGTVYHYYALPTAAVLLAPLTALPENVFVAGWIVVQFAAAVYVVRRLGLPWWWIAFPPLVSGILAGNPSPLLIGLLVAAHPLAKAIAVMLKVYAIVPLLGERRWRAILVAGVLGSLTVLLAPALWIEFIAGSGDRTSQQLAESTGGFSAFGDPVLMAGAVAGLLLIARRDLRTAGWLAPIALWPGSQFHWSTLAMPVMTLPMAWLLALPAHGLPPLAVMMYAAIGEFRSVRKRQNEASVTEGHPSA
jgi:hypothetical protein